MTRRRFPAPAPAVALVLLATQGSIPVTVRAQDAIPVATLVTLDMAGPVESSTPAESTRPVSHADSLAFQGVSSVVSPRTRVRVSGPTGSFEARGSDVTLQGIRALTSGEAAGAGPGLVSWSEIQQVQVRGGAAGKGALIGGATLCLIGGALALIASNLDVGLGPSSGPKASEIVGVTVGFTAAGAFLGGMIGALTPRWKTIHTWAGF